MDPRRVIELPGDYDNLKTGSKEEVMELAKRFGVAEKWGLN
jgi:hypothetical protein